MMEAKKNPKKDMTKNSSLYFVAGLALVLACTYIALEWKTFYGNEMYNVSQNIEEELLEEIELFQIEKLPPPVQPAAPEIIEVVEDDIEVKETVIESTESDEETEVMEVDEVEFAEEPTDVDVPFSVIENVPVFPGCEKEKDKRACFNTKMNNHIRKNFRYPEIAQEMGVQGRVSVMFTIQKDGSIGNVRLRGPDKNLEKEAARIISKLPKMTPGKQRGKAVRVPFSIPITFKLGN
jgi:protein TonB